MPLRPPCIFHCTPEPGQFYGRSQELALLNEALNGSPISILAMIGPGGQGKTAIAQTWIQSLLKEPSKAEGIFLWSFYRGKDVDHCLRELYRHALGLDHVPDLSASYCVDRLLPLLRKERWAIVLDGTEVVQHEVGSWHGRYVHPELGRLLEELASQPMPGVLALTTRFALPSLQHRPHARLLSLNHLDEESALGLLRGLGVRGEENDLKAGAAICGFHAKAVELLGTYLVRFCQGRADGWKSLPIVPDNPEASAEENRVTLVLSAFGQILSQESQDILALATSFRHPPRQDQLISYLASEPVRKMLHEHWGRAYSPFTDRKDNWIANQLDNLCQLRLLETVHGGREEGAGQMVVDAHPLVRRGFAHVLGAHPEQQARLRAGFLRGRPDRQSPQRLEETREEVELFHAWCDAGMWNEADSVYVALNNPKHRFLAPAFERDLLLRFFPDRDFHQAPLWAGFGRYRSLAMCQEMLGDFTAALELYQHADAPLRGDALLALGQFQPLLQTTQVGQPWENLWQSYRCHALALAGRREEALKLAQTVIPVDIYEWVHHFECLLRLGRLDLLDLDSLLYRSPFNEDHLWSRLARRRMKLDYLRITSQTHSLDLDRDYQELLEEYDRGGLPHERALSRLSHARWLLATQQLPMARSVLQTNLELAERQGMKIILVDTQELLASIPGREKLSTDSMAIRNGMGYWAPARP